MSSSAVRLRLDISLEPDADDGAVDEAALRLRDELLELDIAAVRRPQGGEPPPGAKGHEVAVVGSLVVNAARGTVAAIVGTVQAWVARSSSRTVKLTIDGDSIEVTNVSEEHQRRLIEAFIARHGAGSP